MVLIRDLLFRLSAAVIVVVFREVVKSIVAYFSLHPVYKESTKIETNLLKYIDPFGLIMFVFSGVGWQKPAEYVPRNFKNKSRSVLVVALSGFLANILLIMTVIVSMKFVTNNLVREFYIYIVVYNVALIVVNLLPVPPLDMAKILYATSPNFYFKIIQNQRMIHSVFLIVLVFGGLSLIINPILSVLFMALM